MTAMVNPARTALGPGLAGRSSPDSASPLVSFITPAYNAAATIDETIRSVRAQTSPSWELLIIDDGSSDDTLAKAQAWAAQDPRILAMSKTNGGPAEARNFGLARARGEWLAFLDADDWLAPTFIDDMLAHGDGADVLVAAHDRVGPTGEPMGRAPAPVLPDAFAILARRCPIVPVAAVVRAAIARRIGGFDPTVVSSEDWQFWQRAARCGARFRTVPKSLSYYRMLPGSLSRRTERYAADAVRVIDEAFTGADAAGDAADAHDAQGGYLLYAAALAACGGGDPAAVFAHAPDLTAWSFDPAPWGRAIADLAAYAATRRRDEIAATWDELNPRLERLYAALADVMAAPEHAARLRLHVRAQILGAASLDDAPRESGARLVAIDVAAPARDILAQAHAQAGADADTLVIAATARGRALGVIEAPFAALADPRLLRPFLRDLVWRAPLKPAMSGSADAAMVAAIVRSTADIGGWSHVGGARRALWAMAMRAVAVRLSGAPLAVGAPPLALLLVRDRTLSANALAPRLAALTARGIVIEAGAAVAARAETGRAQRHRSAILALDGLALGGGHPVFTAAPRTATVFAPAGPAGQALRADARHRGMRLGLRCLPEEALARRSSADAVAWFAAARAELDDPAPGILFAPGDVDALTRWAARQAGFAFGVNPEPDVADLAQDPLAWRRLEVRATDTAAALAGRIGSLR